MSAVLDAASAQALRDYVTEAKAAGWTQAQVRQFFDGKGIALAAYKAALAGEEVSPEVRSVLVQISITGLEGAKQPLEADIRRHIEWHVSPARGAYDDALFEIAYNYGSDGGINRARMFALDEVDEAVAFVLERNRDGHNMYIGAALRTPDAPRKARGSQETFYVGLSVPIDIDTDYDATRARMAAVVEDGCVVITGLTPERRSQHWVRLLEPCDDDLDYGGAFAALVQHTGADMKVKDSARVMRLAGTLSYPSEKKIALGYQLELVGLTINEAARPVAIETLRALDPRPDAVVAGWNGERPVSNGEIVRGPDGRVTDGRETFFRDLLLRELRAYHTANGADPSAQEIFDAAWVRFLEEADNDDGRWIGEHGRKELRQRADNTIKRLRAGRLARSGIYSMETGAGEAEALAHQAAWDAAHPVEFSIFREREQAKAAPETDDEEVKFPGLFRASSFTGEPPERQWLVQEWIVEGAVNSLYGDGGLGKTLLAQQLACAVSHGEPWLGLPTKQGSVLAILCEDDKNELHRRHNDIKAAMGHAIGNPFEDVWLWPRVGDENVLVQWNKDSVATLGAFAAGMIDAVKAVSPSLLILDTLADFYGGNEIDRGQVNYFVKTVLGGLIKSQGAAGSPLTILLLGHPSVAGKATGAGYSGSTAWNAAVRSRMYLSRPDDEAPADERVLTRGKANYAKSGDETAIKLFYDDGVLRPVDEVSEGSSLLVSVQNDVCGYVKCAWNSSAPFSGLKGHERYIYSALVPRLMTDGIKKPLAVQAIKLCIETDMVKLAREHGKRGYKNAE